MSGHPGASNSYSIALFAYLILNRYRHSKKSSKLVNSPVTFSFFEIKISHASDIHGALVIFLCKYIKISTYRERSLCEVSYCLFTGDFTIYYMLTEFGGVTIF